MIDMIAASPCGGLVAGLVAGLIPWLLNRGRQSRTELALDRLFGNEHVVRLTLPYDGRELDKCMAIEWPKIRDSVAKGMNALERFASGTFNCGRPSFYSFRYTNRTSGCLIISMWGRPDVVKWLEEIEERTEDPGAMKETRRLVARLEMPLFRRVLIHVIGR